MLRDEIGEILRAEDADGHSIATRLQYGYATINLLDKLFDAAIMDMRYEYVNLDELSLDAPYKPAVAAIRGSFLFRLADSIEETAKINISKGLLPKKVQFDATNFIHKFCNKHFKYRQMQLDCEYMIKAINSDLCIFAESNNISTGFVYDQTINLRAISKQKSSLICNEIVALKRIKEDFNLLFNNIKILLYDIECIAYKLRNKHIVNNISELDI